MLRDFAVLARTSETATSSTQPPRRLPLPKLIVWLDELQRFIDGPYLTPGSTPIMARAVSHLLDAPAPVVVLGAMWSEHVGQLRAAEPDPHAPGQRPRYPPGRRRHPERRGRSVSRR